MHTVVGAQLSRDPFAFLLDDILFAEGGQADDEQANFSFQIRRCSMT
jgi:hypothetical protein